MDVLTARSPSPMHQWTGGSVGSGWGESPHGELDFGADRDIEDLTKQLEKERWEGTPTHTHTHTHTHTRPFSKVHHPA